MRTLVEEVVAAHSADSLAASLRNEPGLVLLRTGSFDVPSARYSLAAARPFLTFRAWGARCETHTADGIREQFGDPWHLLDALMAGYELLDELDVPFPLGGCFGYWGYDLKQFVEPRLPRRVVDDLEFPDCHLGFHDSLVVFDHHLGRASIIATGLAADGSRTELRAREQLGRWKQWLAKDPDEGRAMLEMDAAAPRSEPSAAAASSSSFTRAGYIAAVEQALRFIRAGDIYQVNLAQRFSAPWPESAWGFFERLAGISPAPFSAYLDCGDFRFCSSSPELFLRLSGAHIVTRPIKGTRPRSPDPVRDAQLTYELQRSEKEMAELVMITDLLRNDLGRVCEFGSIHVPELARLERYALVQHLVSTIEGRLRPGLTHLDALAACFPGGSITGAPKIRAMEIIDELEPVVRGPYCGCHGYLGFNRESQLSITIRTALVREGRVWFHAGAGIVSDSNPEAEYEETLAKAKGFFSAVGAPTLGGARPSPGAVGVRANRAES